MLCRCFEWAGGILTDVGDQICCDYPATLGKIVEVVCDGHDSCANYGDVEIDEKDAEEEPASVDSTRVIKTKISL